jgi:hypothetical protein
MISWVGRRAPVAVRLAGRGVAGVAFRGFAPGAAIRSVRGAEEQVDYCRFPCPRSRRTGSPPESSGGRQRAAVVNVSIVLAAGSAGSVAAVAYVYRHAVPVVARATIIIRTPRRPRFDIRSGRPRQDRRRASMRMATGARQSPVGS